MTWRPPVPYTSLKPKLPERRPTEKPDKIAETCDGGNPHPRTVPVAKTPIVLPTTTLSDRPRSRVLFPPLARLRGVARQALSRLAVPGAVLAAGWSLATFSGRGGTGTAETEYLTWLATGVLSAVAMITRRPGLELGLGGILAVLMLWVVPPGPSRGAGLTAMLLGLLVLATVRCWGPGGPAGERSAADAAGTDEPPSPGRLGVSAFATIFGFQLLMGAEGLLDVGPDPATLGRFVLLPALAATGLAVLVRTSGTLPALIAAAGAATVGGGWGAGTALTMTALAGGCVLGGAAKPGGGGGARGGLAAGWAVRSMAGLALVAPLLWQQRAGAIAAAAGLALALTDPAPSTGRQAEDGADGAGADGAEAPPRDPLWLRAGLPLLPVVAVVMGAAVMPLHPWRQGVEAVLHVPLLVPAALLPAVLFPAVLFPALVFPAALQAGRARPVLTLAAVGLALAAGRGTPDSTILAAPVALAALSLPPRKMGQRGAPTVGGGALGELQGLWSLALLGLTALAATYPWLRPDPLVTAAAWLGPASAGGGGAGLPAAALLAPVPIFLLASLSRWLTPRRRALGLGAALALLLLLHLPPTPRTVLHPGGRVLDVGNPELELPLDGSPIRRVVLDTHLAHAGALLRGVPVAVVRLEDRSGDALEWPLRMGEETGEWAAARPDLARRSSLVSPSPWLSQVVEAPELEERGDATGTPETSTFRTQTARPDRRFFAYRYRTVLEVEAAAWDGADEADRTGEARRPPRRPSMREPVRLLLRRSRNLPQDVSLAVFHLETRP